MSIIHKGMRTICAVVRDSHDLITAEQTILAENLDVIQRMAKNMEAALVRKNETIAELEKEIKRLEGLV